MHSAGGEKSSINADSTTCASAAQRARTPTVSIELARGSTPCVLIAPCVGRMPTTPQHAAGIRTEPPVSVPSATGTMPAATAAAEPLLDPPDMCPNACGLRVGPVAARSPVGPFANSCVVVFPITIAPARLSRSTQSASRVAIRFTKWRELAVVGRLVHRSCPSPLSAPRAADPGQHLRPILDRRRLRRHELRPRRW